MEPQHWAQDLKQRRSAQIVPTKWKFYDKPEVKRNTKVKHNPLKADTNIPDRFPFLCIHVKLHLLPLLWQHRPLPKQTRIQKGQPRGGKWVGPLVPGTLVNGPTRWPARHGHDDKPDPWWAWVARPVARHGQALGPGLAQPAWIRSLYFYYLFILEWCLDPWGCA